jgi:hypothetical protein
MTMSTITTTLVYMKNISLFLKGFIEIVVQMVKMFFAFFSVFLYATVQHQKIHM